jgi:hypothetical protein
MSLPQHILYWLTHDNKMVAAEVPPSQSGRRAWIGVYPPSRSKNFFKIRYFEVEKSLLEHDYDIAEPELLNSERFTAANEAELEEILGRWLDDPNKLVQPYFCDYPI